jgi:hypothetical protein
MDRWLVAILVVVALVITGFLLTTSSRRSDVASGPPVPEPELAPPTPSSLLPSVQVDFGDAPEYHLPNPATHILYKGSDIVPRFPTIKNFEDDDWYISHSQPFREIFLGEVASPEGDPLVVDRDDDDGLLTRTLAACQTQGVELLITIPTTATPGTPLYLNALFDWSQNGSWSGASERCGFALPEWAIQNLRLDRAPYDLTAPGIYRILVAVTSGGPGNVWARFTVTTVEVPKLATNEWHGQGQFVYGESEDWIVAISVTQQGIGVPSEIPAPPVKSPPTTPPPPVTAGPPVQKTGEPLPEPERERKSKEIQKGNNGVGNGIDDQPPGNPPCNDCVGTGPGNPGNKGGPKGDTTGDQEKGPDQQDKGTTGGKDKDQDKDKDKDSNGGAKDKGKDKGK